MDRLLASGLIGHCRYVLVEAADRDFNFERSRVVEILGRLAEAANAPILLHGEGASAWSMLEEAVRRGLSTRMGFEDTLVLKNGQLAGSNAELIAASRLGGARGCGSGTAYC